MSPPKTPKTPKGKLWASVIIMVLLAISVYMVINEAPSPLPQPLNRASDSVSGFSSDADILMGASPARAMFSGVNKVSAEKIKALFPGTQGKPLFVEFKSKYCLDCKRMTPLLEGLFPSYPEMETHIYDIKADAKKNSAVFDAFKPSIVPILLFIQPDGSTQEVFYGYHPKAELKKALDRLNKRHLKEGSAHHGS